MSTPRQLVSTEGGSFTIDEVVRFRCEDCLDRRGATTMPREAWSFVDGELSPPAPYPLWPVNVRDDGYVSSRSKMTGTRVVSSLGRSGKTQRGPLRSGRPDGWERDPRDGVVYLRWYKPCSCGRLAGVRETTVRRWIRAARETTPGPVTVDIPPNVRSV